MSRPSLVLLCPATGCLQSSQRALVRHRLTRRPHSFVSRETVDSGVRARCAGSRLPSFFRAATAELIVQQLQMYYSAEAPETRFYVTQATALIVRISKMKAVITLEIRRSRESADTIGVRLACPGKGNVTRGGLSTQRATEDTVSGIKMYCSDAIGTADRISNGSAMAPRLPITTICGHGGYLKTGFSLDFVVKPKSRYMWHRQKDRNKEVGSGGQAVTAFRLALNFSTPAAHDPKSQSLYSGRPLLASLLCPLGKMLNRPASASRTAKPTMAQAHGPVVWWAAG
ncbi:hypothetical protein GGX14DRAFT_395369 [Mycena pura]|uniref:Uncharacterized protein n=1 Tax=Mycena pura TaxID=153505 RepID=A0AAD6VD87_9AGAR|nr:hypothetical protein GGX14DRAFT_395369 [Mycena pura]